MADNTQNKHISLMQVRVAMPYAIGISLIFMTALVFFVYGLSIPNPNMILIAGLVLCSALFGYPGGITAGVIMFFYTLFFFSTDHSFVQYTTENLQKVIVSFVGIVVDMLLVCGLKRREVKAFDEATRLAESLRSENEQLHDISMTDGLTCIRNRLALRREYDKFQDSDVVVMMMDVDDFKWINDRFGREEGDRVLRETGVLMSEVFGKEHCYRYGGDEFLVIYPDISESEFQTKLDGMMEKRPMLDEVSGKKVSYSFGFVRGSLNEPNGLRELFSEADEKMCEAKRRHNLETAVSV